jgi:predicted XRE-type DNA-binding protein
MTRRTHEVGSGNVFADIGAPNAYEHLAKAQLVLKIDALKRGLKQIEAAVLFGVKQPDVSKMLGASSGNSPSNGCFVSLSRLARMSRS